MASWSSQIREKFRQFGQWISSFQQFGKGSSCSSIAQVKQIRVSNDFIMAIIPLSQRQVLWVLLSHTLPRVVAELQCVQVCVRRVWCVCVCVCACVFASLSDKPKQVTRRALVQGVCWPPRRVDKDFCKTNTRVTRRSCQYNAALWPTARQLLRHLLQYNT